MVEHPCHRNQSQGNLDNNHSNIRDRQETSNDNKNKTSSSSTNITTSSSTTNTTPNNISSFNDSHLHYLDACKIWFNPDGARAANELKQLPLEEREKVWADLTGREATTTFTQNIVEDPIVIRNKLHELKQAIVKDTTGTGSSSTTNAFQMVLTSNPEYVYDTRFLLKFLRATGYSINESAIRINQHFEMKRNLFGDEVLGRDIRLEDLDVETEAVMELGGCCQPLQLTDVGGRTVVIDRPEKWTNTARRTLFQWIWYLRMVLACDENIQKLGIVSVVYCLDRYERQDLETIRLFHSQLTPVIPLRISARYAVFEDKAWKQVLDFEQVIVKQPARMRFRSIQGSYEICMYSLMCVGIPIQSMPNDMLDIEGKSNNINCKNGSYIHNLINNRSDNNVIDNYLHGWIQKRHAIESLSSAPSKKRQHVDIAGSIPAITSSCDDAQAERRKIHNTRLKRRSTRND